MGALRQQQEQQERDRQVAGTLWQEHGLVFASTVGTPLNANNVIRAFRLITKKAGLGEDWAPRELRHTFVSVMSASGVPVENIALLVGHDRTATTESVYRHEIRPALTQGAEVAAEDKSALEALVDPTKASGLLDGVPGAKEANLISMVVELEGTTKREARDAWGKREGIPWLADALEAED